MYFTQCFQVFLSFDWFLQRHTGFCYMHAYCVLEWKLFHFGQLEYCFISYMLVAYRSFSVVLFIFTTAVLKVTLLCPLKGCNNRIHRAVLKNKCVIFIFTYVAPLLDFNCIYILFTLKGFMRPLNWEVEDLTSLERVYQR